MTDDRISMPVRPGSRLIIALVIAASIAVGELVGGMVSNSLALIGDAGHMFTDVGALSISLIAFRLAQKPATAERTFGLLRAEIIAALANGAILFFVAVFVIFEGIGRLGSEPDVDAGIVLPVAVVGLIANLIGASILREHAGHSLNFKGAFYHMLSDAASSVAVIASSVFILMTGETAADTIVSFIVAALIFRGSFALLSESFNILVEAVPPHIDLVEVQRSIEEIPEISNVHDLHVWTITSGILAFSGHMVVGDRSVRNCAGIIETASRLLRERYGITHTTWQLECDSCGEENICVLDRLKTDNKIR